MDQVRMHGKWWLPGAKEDAVSGELNLEGNVIRLDLVEPFHVAPEEQTYTVRPEDVPIVLGIAEGKRVTLADCTLTRYPRSFGVFVTGGAAWARAAYVGGHFASIDETAFPHWLVRLDGLEEWAGRSGLTVPPRGSDGVLVFSPRNS